MRNNTYYHKASDSYFTMLERGGKLVQRRYQLDSAGRQVNVMEKQVDFIMGSGNHARAYLSRTARGTLVELPLAWYAEKGGYWAMNPGYDRPNHDGFRRPITYDCMFCHNAYPQIPAGHDQPFAEPVYGASLPDGIDCQRCHGPGEKHAQLAGSGKASREAIRSAITNPSRLSTQRQMELCMSCHLESTSFPLPNALLRYERGPFSYQPGEPLEDFILNFDHAKGTGREGKFEIVSAAYRLRQSACFLKSGGKLLCTTCHNPHDVPRGEEATRHYAAVCRTCHASSFNGLVAAGSHTKSADCTGCHMPKRRTEDVVHVVVTDHYIQRRKPAGDLLADLAERHETGSDAYRGPVALYYPVQLPHTPQNDLYLAIAQVKQGSNLTDGIPQLTAALERLRPARPEYYFELGEAWRQSGDWVKAVNAYRDAVARNSKFLPGLEKLGSGLRRTGRNEEAETVLRKALVLAPDDPIAWHELGLTLRAAGKPSDAIAAWERALQLDPEMPEANNNLGIVLLAGGDRSRAEGAFREAIRLQPDYADAHANLGALLSAAGDFAGANDQFQAALRSRPEDAATRYNYAMALGRARRYDDAQRELEAAVRTDPDMADAQLLLGDLLMAKNQAQQAGVHYQEALRIYPESGRAHLGLAAALITSGDRAGAKSHLEKAATDPTTRDEAQRMLRQLQ